MLLSLLPYRIQKAVLLYDSSTHIQWCQESLFKTGRQCAKQDLSLAVTVPSHQFYRPATGKDRHSRVERYQLETHLLTAQIETLQSHVTAYINDQPPNDLNYTPNPLSIIAAGHSSERDEIKSSWDLAKEVQKLRMTMEELLAVMGRMKTEYEQRQLSRRIRYPPRMDRVPR
ncbi:uncharacterized protein BT62DRAFT_934192 [Guyanagaster necrorhizus]|uniref:Uncharacterized protein n=1 Tax=Guyanagaster necrorhizus TaxID=856835 RepID=A0A9P7VPY8_9AGAR|nr:uncharacterized protein BT62DRAFT_934192 [Guyanagaster necrorhizus MCA 3950]KAG7444550.1 hypothetical protein BT62DRAFT_934192 [Guyanagaster necrorhizus MCA 3950]